MIQRWSAAMYLFAHLGTQTPEAGPLVTISVPDDQSDWSELNRYLNEELRTLNASIRIKFTKRDIDSALHELANPSDNNVGALLPPFRYVVADLVVNDLELVARIRRAGRFVVPQSDWDNNKRPDSDPEYAEYNAPEPLDHYRSLVVMHRNSGVWPPPLPRDLFRAQSIQERNLDKVTISFSGYRSTSEFVYPFAHITRKGWRDRIVESPRRTAGRREDAWKLKMVSVDSAHYGDKREIAERKQLTESLASETGDFQLFCTSDHKFYASYPNEKARHARFEEVYRSPPIPFDALVVRKSALGLVELQKLRRAFLSTRDMAPKERAECFPWSPTEDDNQSFLRSPDVHDFVEADDAEYDKIRQEAAVAFGGAIVRVAVAKQVHRSESRDMMFFRQWMKDVLKAQPDSPVFLDFVYYDSFDEIATDLKDGRVHLGELNVTRAATLLGREEGVLLGRSVFGGEDFYRFVIVTAEPNKKTVDSIQTAGPFAITSRASGSGFVYPVEYLQSRGRSPKERIEVGNADNVLDAVLRYANESQDPKSALYGFMADFEFEKIRRRWPEKAIEKIGTIEVHEEQARIPNAMLIASKGAFPMVGTWFQRLSTGHEKDESSDGRNATAVEQPLSTKTTDILRDAIIANLSSEAFGGYRRATQDDVDELSELYWKTAKRPVAIIVGVLAVGIIASTLCVIWVYRRGVSSSSEDQRVVSIQSIWDVLKGGVPDDRMARDLICIGLQIFGQLKDDDGKLKKVFGSPAALRKELGDALLAVLVRHQSDRTLSDETYYYTHLDRLDRVVRKATSEIDNYLSRVDRPETSESADWLSKWVRTLDTVKKLID